MINFVNDDIFWNWYKVTAKGPLLTKKALLDDVFKRYCDTKNEAYILSPDETVSGTEEVYNFKFEDIGCCGASTIYIYF